LCAHHEGYRGGGVIAPYIFISEMDGDKLHAPATLPPGKEHGTHQIGGWIDSRTSLDLFEEEKISCPFQESNTNRQVHNVA
jgi:hypothetical protein